MTIVETILNRQRIDLGQSVVCPVCGRTYTESYKDDFLGSPMDTWCASCELDYGKAKQVREEFYQEIDQLYRSKDRDTLEKLRESLHYNYYRSRVYDLLAMLVEEEEGE